MALITRCPVCGTLFKVVPDQLRISEGWVRCGQCTEVFDASVDLQQSDAEHQLVQPLEPLPDALADLPAPGAATHGLMEPLVSSVQDIDMPEHEPALLSPMVGESDVLPGADPALLLDIPVTAADSHAPDVSPAVAPEDPLLADSLPQYSFIREPAPLAVVSRRPVSLALWIAAAGLLLVAMLVQAMLYGRDHIAATWPETKPWLQAVCEPLACTVQPLRRIDAVVIDSSTLSALQNEDAYRLSLVLKNQARLDVAMPAIEFVLTDIDEQAVFRRVLTADELGAASRVLFAGREWGSSVDVRVGESPDKSRIVGYRLLAFYP